MKNDILFGQLWSASHISGETTSKTTLCADNVHVLWLYRIFYLHNIEPNSRPILR